jgi:hypothetical protein
MPYLTLRRAVVRVHHEGPVSKGPQAFFVSLQGRQPSQFAPCNGSFTSGIWWMMTFCSVPSTSCTSRM